MPRFAVATIGLAMLAIACVGPLPDGSTRPTASRAATAGASTTPSTATPSPTPEPSTQPAPAPPFGTMAFTGADHGLLGGAEPNGIDSGATPTLGVPWRTTDRAASWQPMPYDGPPIVAMAAAAHDHVWAAAGCLDRTCPSRIIGSDDAGTTWSIRSDRLVIALSFLDERRGWAVTGSFPPDAAELLGTSDGGRSWTTLRRPCPIGIAVAVSFVSRAHGWVGCADQPGAGQQPKAVVETDDGGRTWILRAEASPDKSVGEISMSDYLSGIAMRPSGVGLMWMGRGTTTRTSDGGRRWSNIPPGEFDVVLPAAGVTLDDRTWFLVAWDGNEGRQVIEMTGDAGTTWQMLARLPG